MGDPSTARKVIRRTPNNEAENAPNVAIPLPVRSTARKVIRRTPNNEAENAPSVAIPLPAARQQRRSGPLRRYKRQPRARETVDFSTAVGLAMLRRAASSFRNVSQSVRNCVDCDQNGHSA